MAVMAGQAIRALGGWFTSMLLVELSPGNADVRSAAFGPELMPKGAHVEASSEISSPHIF